MSLKGDTADAVLGEVTAVAAGDDGVLRGGFRYDNLAIALHWGTALLVLTLFGLAHVWSFFPHDGPTQLAMQTTHVSLGVILTAVVVVRLEHFLFTPVHILRLRNSWRTHAA